MVNFGVGEANARSTFFDKMIKQVTDRSYVMKQAVSVVSSDAWTNYFFREDTSLLSAGSGTAVKGISRGAEFPTADAAWDRVSTTLEKYGMESVISWEDLKTNQIDVQTRTSIKLGEAVAYAVDSQIYTAITTDGAIQSFAIANGYEWNSTSAAILDDLFQGAEKIKDYNYPTDTLLCFVNSREKRSIMKYLAEKGAQFPQIANDVALNGEIGNLAGIKILESKAIAASRALIVVPKRCGTWRELQALTTITKEDPYKSLVIRAVEAGVLNLSDPKAVVFIKNTRA